MLPNMLKGTLCVNSNYAGPCHIPQMQWKCPPKINLDSNWHVAAGEESTEAVSQRRDTTDPRPSAPFYMTSDNADNKTPVIPLNPIELEEEGSLQKNSLASFLSTDGLKGEKQKEVLTVGTPEKETIILAESVKHSDVENPDNSKSPAPEGEMMAVAMAGAAAAITAYALHQDKKTSIDMGLLMQFLSNPDTVHKLISEQSFPGIEPASILNKPTLSVPLASSKPDHLRLNTIINCVPVSTGVVISKPDARTSSVSIQNSRLEQGAIDIDLLTRLLRNPKVIEELIKEYDASDRSGSLSASMMKTAVDQPFPATAITSEPLLSRVNTTGKDSSPTITGVPFLVPRTIYSSVFTTSTKMSLIDKELPYLETTMAPMSPLHSLPSANMEPSVRKIGRPEGRVTDGMRMEPRPETRLIPQVLPFSLPQLSGLPSVQPNVLRSFLQMSPVSPEFHPHPAFRVSAPVPMLGTNLMSSLGLVPFPGTEFTMSKANLQSAANMGPLPSVFSHPNPLMQAVAHPENHGICISDKTVHGGGFGLPTANVLRSFQQFIPVSPEIYPRPVLGVSDPVCMPVTKLMTSLGLDPFPRPDLFTLPKANSQPGASTGPFLLGFSHSNPLIRAVAHPENCGNVFGEKTRQLRDMQRTMDNGFLSLHDHTQLAGQGLSPPKSQKPCIYFNTLKGYWNGTNCPYMHIRYEQSAPPRVEELHGAKRMKLG
ncbi:uncharacterized protein LOC141687168 [Apium graveolens]|uniref:uncharacterized protein LOC141687168 n=1 Tax=Apium graveolens TaxID=4045 RepID=UPI003D79818D